MGFLSITDIVANSNMQSAVMNSSFQDIEDFLSGITAAANITITGTYIASQYKTSVDGTAIAASGAISLGAADDCGAYWDGSNLVLDQNTALTSAIQHLNLIHRTSGTPAAGIGTGIKFITETSASNNEIGMVLESESTDVTEEAENFDLVVKLMLAGGAATEKLRLFSSGVLKVPGGFESGFTSTTAAASETKIDSFTQTISAGDITNEFVDMVITAVGRAEIITVDAAIFDITANQGFSEIESSFITGLFWFNTPDATVRINLGASAAAGDIVKITLKHVG